MRAFIHPWHKRWRLRFKGWWQRNIGIYLRWQ